jgi:hypothetical protein
MVNSLGLSNPKTIYIKSILMKATEFRKLIREEVRRALKESESRELIKYFKAAGAPLTPQFNLKKMSAAVGMDANTLLMVLQNLEDKNVLKDISKGSYTSFDIYDSSQFNDSYNDMIDDLDLDSTKSNVQTSTTSSTKTTHAVLIDLGDFNSYDVTSLEDLSIPKSIKSLVTKPKASMDPEDDEVDHEEVEKYMNAVKEALVDVGKKIVPGISWLATNDGTFHLKLPTKPTPQIQSKLKSIYSGAKAVEFKSA